jgi:hypothetical protein
VGCVNPGQRPTLKYKSVFMLRSRKASHVLAFFCVHKLRTSSQRTAHPVSRWRCEMAFRDGVSRYHANHARIWRVETNATLAVAGANVASIDREQAGRNGAKPWSGLPRAQCGVNLLRTCGPLPATRRRGER